MLALTAPDVPLRVLEVTEIRLTNHATIFPAPAERVFVQAAGTEGYYCVHPQLFM